MKKLKKSIHLQWKEITTFSSDPSSSLKETEEKKAFNKNVDTIWSTLKKMSSKRKLPSNDREVVEALADSLKNVSEAYERQSARCMVVDTENILNQLKEIK